jgi:hypothetical protein
MERGTNTGALEQTLGDQVEVDGAEVGVGADRGEAAGAPDPGGVVTRLLLGSAAALAV